MPTVVLPGVAGQRRAATGASARRVSGIDPSGGSMIWAVALEAVYTRGQRRRR
ncbi:hypothetical protein Ae706Ps2_6182 [Pseudonocardia sp. Ae706_Ps2]|nr:hypothetical protein Ae331Ps2_6098 [Pseudonocardia sp. Ae331_Ps2]OLM08616.1 hypothetical protein Ae505Ps2_6003c [Pseudonocardia sp. Ae505_Ps2]OLM08621.1 hypothetical protein Ae505Ps2_6008c [Pseudonocardia sp. Ae505_Ps2]OLM09720.1 hypothetical protein Ae706Ps2_6182 [Pseudonocardia sp. Ae706_Ps2]